MLFRQSVLFFFFIGQAFSMSAQVAPNFTVTDSWGNIHRLYEDYLDQGVTVVIKVFYVACPPCNAIAPHLEPLYQSWGGGDADVQFIELSIKQTDTDALVNGYKNNHQTTYPASGGQGGSVAAVTPYTSGMFGVYTGTPTFVVIAPDKTVNYDVSGFNIQGTIDAIDAAIEATGALGEITSTGQPEPSFPIRLLSNLVRNEIVLSVMREVSSFELSIINPLGQVYKREKYFVQKGDAVLVDISLLPVGVWICRIERQDHQGLASYLFVKE